MAEEISSNKRIAKNTIMLYIRMFISMVVGLYTSRVVLATLGVQDYGIYGVVGGVIGMMGFLNASMSGATSRFLTYELGRGDKERLAKTFSSALIVHIIIALVVLVLAETVGLWFLCNKLNIPAGRMEAAHWVYQLSILGAMLGITQVPYNATIIAHEKMDVYAYMEILNVTLKLLIVYLLTIGHFDKLKLYAVLTLAVSIISMMIYRIYCIRHFEESRFHFIWDKSYLKPLLSFSGWNIYCEMAFSIRQQGASFVLNSFYGVIYNAASSIALTLQGVLLGFSSNIIMAFRPPIIKEYASKNFERMNQTICLGAKISMMLITIITIPFFVKTGYVLKLWLTTVPKGAIDIARIMFLVNIVNTSSYLLVTGIQASGKMNTYSSICGSLYILSVLVMYGLMKLNFDFYWIYLVILITSIVVNMVYAGVLKKQIAQFHLRKFYKKAVIPAILAGILALGLSYYSCTFFNETAFNFIVYCIYSVALSLAIFIVFTFNKEERAHTLKYMKSAFNRKFK